MANIPEKRMRREENNLAMALRGMSVVAVSAKWDKFGKMAGPLRNSTMIHCYEPNLVVAFHNDIANSKGTKNMVNQAKLAGIEVKIITEGN